MSGFEFSREDPVMGSWRSEEQHRFRCIDLGGLFRRQQGRDYLGDDCHEGGNEDGFSGQVRFSESKRSWISYVLPCRVFVVNVWILAECAPSVGDIQSNFHDFVLSAN